MSEYIKSLEEQNEELKQKLANCELLYPRWEKDTRTPPPFAVPNATHWWYLIVGKDTIIAAIHHVKDVRVEGYKICILKTSLSWRPSCNVDAEFHETATTGNLEAAQSYCEDRLING